ncbi:MAG: hypothetical protein AMJ63_06520 [Myxococcales bacterium SG8_38_1]|nr:MAG: hypothetical protein AMJ63_06520 [Myxococcales bacterium SG8_38_1]
MPDSVLTDNGPKPTDTTDRWGVEVESTDLEGHMMPSFYQGQTKFFGLVLSGLLARGRLGHGIRYQAAFSATARGLRPQRHRGHYAGAKREHPRDRLWRQQWRSPRARSHARLRGLPRNLHRAELRRQHARVVEREQPSIAFPTFGDAAGGFELFISEGYSHVDIVSAEDDQTNNVVAPLLAFIERNLE